MSTAYAIPLYWIILNCLLVLLLWLRARRAEKGCASDDAELIDWLGAHGYNLVCVAGVWGVTTGQNTLGAPSESLRDALRAAKAAAEVDHG
ncbi:hypothetical protein [Comamonas antarctica]|uniref:hypothetical protein n=1 Tax=Comamonas antarctica TaxID=2743470 RepID=UPI0028EA298A|nr:hypothetical protein [Comamonas antarctica]